MNGYEIRKKLKKKLAKKGFSKICHLCGKELVILPNDIIFTVNEKTVHYECFRKERNGKKEKRTC